jgi:uncharacterized protein YcfL
MKIGIQTILIIFLVLSCSKDDSLLLPAVLDELMAMNVFCPNSPNDTLRRVVYVYNNDKMITETTLYNGEIQSKTTFEYNLDNQLTLEIYETDWKKTEKTFIYNELNQLVNIIYKFTDYDSNGVVIDESESEAPLEYENNQLVKEWECWGGFSTYEYKDGKVVTKIDYTKNGEKHHITSYKYSGKLKIEEKKETSAGNVIYIRTFHYDSKNRLIKIIEDKNIIEENDYIENKLTEKRTYYFGIDPGFFVCNGNYIYRYEY